MEKTGSKFLEQLGLKVLQVFSTKSHEVFKCTLEVKCKTVAFDFLRSLKKEDGEPLPASIKLDNNLLWSFQEEKFPGIARVTKIKGHLLIAFISYDQKLIKVLPVSDLVGTMPGLRGNTKVRIGGMKEVEVVDLKILASKQLKIQCLPTEYDKELIRRRNDAVRKRQEKKTADKVIARKERVAEITSREPITVYTQGGKSLFGIPVVNSEWECLPDGRAVVLVESYDGKDAVGPLEHFFVSKKKGGGNPQKGRVTINISVEKAAAVKSKEPVFENFISVEIDLEKTDIAILTREELKHCLERGVNGSSPVAIGKKDRKGMIQVVALQGNKYESIGHFKVLAENI